MLYIAAVALGSSTWLYRTNLKECRDITHRQLPWQLAWHCGSSVLSWTQCCVQVLSPGKLQITDDEYLTVGRLFSAGYTWSTHAHDNRHPFYNSCPCVPATRLSNEKAVLTCICLSSGGIFRMTLLTVPSSSALTVPSSWRHTMNKKRKLSSVARYKYGRYQHLCR
jgi:hypothetical protein